MTEFSSSLSSLVFGRTRAGGSFLFQESLFNNNCHGMVRQFQESYFDGNVQSTVKGYSAPDFVAVGQAYGIPSSRLSLEANLPEALAALLAGDGPALLEVPLSVQSKVGPPLIPWTGP